MPGILLALITAHLLLMWYQKHTQWPGPHRTNTNVVGAPFYPAFMAKTGGFFFAVFAVTAGLGALVQINPVWLYGPYNPAQVGAGSQPDFYIGWLEGTLRMMPNLETHVDGHTISWNVLIPAVVIPGILFTAMALYPFLEAWVTRDYETHNICDRPRNRPGRTALGVAVLTELGCLPTRRRQRRSRREVRHQPVRNDVDLPRRVLRAAAPRVHGNSTHLSRACSIVTCTARSTDTRPAAS